MIIGRIRCTECGVEFLCRLADGGQLHSKAFEQACNDGDVCLHVHNGGNYEIVEEEYDGD